MTPRRATGAKEAADKAQTLAQTKEKTISQEAESARIGGDEGEDRGAWRGRGPEDNTGETTTKEERAPKDTTTQEAPKETELAPP